MIEIFCLIIIFYLGFNSSNNIYTKKDARSNRASKKKNRKGY